MKIIAYEARSDEHPYFEAAARQFGVEIKTVSEPLSLGTAAWAAGFDGVTTLGQSRAGADVLDRLAALGIKHLSTRTIGTNHIDLPHAERLGIRVSNAQYEPHGVADFTIMLMLMSIRHYKQALFRGNVNDYSLNGLIGREMRDLTIGVVGCGRIGAQVIAQLQGFGCRILAWSRRPEQAGDVCRAARFVDLDTLLRESDVITLHAALTPETRYLVSRETIARMKDGVVLINCARGELMDNEAVIEGIESKKIGALGLDVIENEEGIFHHDRRTEILINRQMAYIRQFPNVTMTQHMAFYTEQAVRSMVMHGIGRLVAGFSGSGAGKAAGEWM